MSDRQLVTIRMITALSPIPGADFIEVAQIDGWKVVVKKGEFEVGKLCVYFEIDSFLKEGDERFAFLMTQGVRLFNGVRGHRLKTIKLRKQISQGLALPVRLFPEILSREFNKDYSDVLGVVKWEPPAGALNNQMPGMRKHGFPSFIRKTDQERCQNIVNMIFEDETKAYEVTEKLDGSSATFYCKDGKVGVCSRNVHLWESRSWLQSLWTNVSIWVRRRLSLPVYKADSSNHFLRMFEDSGIKGFLENGMFGNIALQGELIHPNIQGNPHRVSEPQYHLYDIWNIDKQAYMSSADRTLVFKHMVAAGVNINHVKVLSPFGSMRTLGIKNIDDLLKYAEGPGLNGHPREGVVFKSLDGSFSFKAISNSYLLKEKDEAPQLQEAA